MKAFTIASIVSLVSAHAINLPKRSTGLEVKIELTGNTAVKALITNTGDSDLKVLRSGSILDDTPVEKAEVFQGDSKVAFDGIRIEMLVTNLSEDVFEVIPAGKTIEKSFDVAHMHDLSAGGSYDIVTSGALAFANAGSTELAGAVTFGSNVIKTDVDGQLAETSRAEFLQKRTIVQSDCTGTRRTQVTTAISNCRSLAATASSAANSNNAKMTEYFKSTSASAKSTVATVFNRIVSECGSTTSGNSRFYCTDVYGACSSNVIAYTLPSQSYMAYCNLFFTMPALSRTCHAQDQATTVLHEATHLTQVKGTSDYNGYGYNFVRSLSSSQNLNHADTYTLFAQALYAGC
ncbi:metallo proteinase [Dendryphion nanum]|uniref:Neutral protease 2 n=1 Tax=Dendryphion nanum TaxID=256645 RepID=A0A9P9EIH7_9PLEO|nr:metallo proteinase [Dendryphion nanum]